MQQPIVQFHEVPWHARQDYDAFSAWIESLRAEDGDLPIEEHPSEEDLINWREANDYVNEGDDDGPPWDEDYDDEEPHSLCASRSGGWSWISLRCGGATNGSRS